MKNKTNQRKPLLIKLIKIVSVFLIAGIFLIACEKDNNNACTPVSPASEAAPIAAFCKTHGINYTVDSNGIYYQVADAGTGSRATINSTITATYSATLLTGQIVDTSHTTVPVTLHLNQFIEGWQLAIPYIQAGGHIKMVIPSALAYGCTGAQGVVPANSPIYFDVLLNSVAN